MKSLLILSICGFCINISTAQSGNVGIGTANPVAKLDVIGSIKITDGTQGDGKVLTSDGDGRASWQPLTSNPPSGPTDAYPGVWIGCSSWMIKNLDVATYRNGDPIPKVTNNAEWASLTTGAYCYFLNDSATYAATYGKLYNWYAINDPRGLAPAGWHIPSDFEWANMANTLGGNFIAGALLKELGTQHWSEPNLGGINTTNFTALPGGSRNASGSFTAISEMGNIGHWWSSTKSSEDSAWSRSMNTDDTEISAENSDMKVGYYIRCIKD